MNNELTIWDYFKSPLYLIEKNEWVDDVNKVCDSYISEQKLISKNNPNYLKEHEHSYRNGQKEFLKQVTIILLYINQKHLVFNMMNFL